MDEKPSKREVKEQVGPGKKLKLTPNPGTVTGAITRKVIYENDPGYKYVEPSIKKSEDNLDFQPIFFLRTHSKNNDPADVQTQIWQCSFEPDTQNLYGHTDIVATCGGTSVCFIYVKTGEVLLKYNRNTKVAATENLYALAWSSLPLDDIGLKKMNILAVGGGRSTVILIHPEAGCCYQMFRTVPNKAAAVVCSLLFHPKKASWLFCGHEDGHIQLWDVGIPPINSYEVTPVHLLVIPAAGGDVYNLSFSHTNDILIAGCDRGLFAWKIDMDKVENNQRLERTEFVLKSESGSVVDSICLIRDDILAFKCALHGYIYLFCLSATLENGTYDSDKGQKEVELKDDDLLKLKWSDTDNYYMNMGGDSISCTLVCGDDKGALWVYDLFPYISGSIKSPLHGNQVLEPIEPSLKLDWPELDDSEVEKARKLRIDTYDIVIDKCTVSDGGRHIVAVTSNNMVCIWKRGDSLSDGNASSDGHT